MPNNEKIRQEEIKTCIEHLRLLKAEIEWDKPIGYQCDIDLAIKALEKQIPKKPKEEWCTSTFSDDNGCSFQHQMCPSCGKVEVRQMNNYCQMCGQALLDWSD